MPLQREARMPPHQRISPSTNIPCLPRSSLRHLHFGVDGVETVIHHVHKRNDTKHVRAPLEGPAARASHRPLQARPSQHSGRVCGARCRVLREEVRAQLAESTPILIAFQLESRMLQAPRGRLLQKPMPDSQHVVEINESVATPRIDSLGFLPTRHTLSVTSSSVRTAQGACVTQINNTRTFHQGP